MTNPIPTYRNSTRSYGAVTKTFHWLTALLIFTAIPLGLIANEWGYDTSQALATKGVLFSLHKTVGITVFFVAVLRIVWAISQPKPGLLHSDRKLESWLAETVHWVLYASLVLAPLSGWLHHAATAGFAPILWPFGQSLPLVPVNSGVSHFFAGLHNVFVKLLAAAVVLHVAGALKHHLIDRDLTLARMLPGQTAAGSDDGAHARAPIAAALVIYAAAIALGSVIGLSSPPEAGSTQDSAQTANLIAPASDWTVQEGSLTINVVQFGSSVEGSFSDWTAAIAFDPDSADPVKGNVTVEIAIGSLTLGSVTAEALKPEFFAADSFPTAIFAAQIIVDPEIDNGYLADGILTLKAAEMPLSLPFTLAIDGATATMSGSTTIDRRDFGIGTESYSDDKTVAFDVEVTVSLTASRAE